MLYAKGLAYQSEALVNYDPVDKTVLANEQVDSQGRSWRSGAVVEQRMLKQWFFNIKSFQNELLDDLDVLAEEERWPSRVIQQQRHWIGRSNGATITFSIKSQDGSTIPVNVFTTRPDTLFGVSYIALSMSHPLVLEYASEDEGLAAFLARKTSFEPDSKDGYRLSLHATNPLQKENPGIRDIPVFVAPYVLEGYGEGAVMGVSGHDSRDFAFWQQNMPDEPFTFVIFPAEATENGLLRAQVEKGLLNSECGKYAGMSSEEGGQQIVHDLQQQNAAKMTQTWRLRDWLISRQRYWGTPIPIVHCSSCGAVPVPDDQLPVESPKLDSIQGQKGNPLDSIESFVNTKCPSCGGSAKRETDTMDTFVDSSWYYARFLDSQNENSLVGSEAAKALPVDMYIGGVEHAILHLLYARFIFKFLCQEGIIPSSSERLSKEPFSRLIAQGMVHGKTFSDPDTGRFLKPEDLIFQNDIDLPLVKATGKPAEQSWEKMSKSKHNGVDPTDCFAKYGADTTRAHMLFAAPLTEVLQWDEQKIVGVQRWLWNVDRLVNQYLKISIMSSERNLDDIDATNAEILLAANSTLLSVTNTIENNVYNINTVISDLIKLTNAIQRSKIENLKPWVVEEAIQVLLKMMAPITPAFSAQCFADISVARQTDVEAEASWPNLILTAEEESQLKALKRTMTCAVQINGKLRFTVEVPSLGKEFEKTGANSSKAAAAEHEEAVLQAILESDPGRQWLQEKNVWETRKKVIFVRGGKLVNIIFPDP